MNREPVVKTYFVSMNGQVQGPMLASKLRQLPGFNLQTLVCRAGTDVWKRACELIPANEMSASPSTDSSSRAQAAEALKDLMVQPRRSRLGTVLKFLFLIGAAAAGYWQRDRLLELWGRRDALIAFLSKPVLKGGPTHAPSSSPAPVAASAPRVPADPGATPDLLAD